MPPKFLPKQKREADSMKVYAYIHSLKDKVHDRNVLGEAEILERIGDNLYSADYNGVRCTAIFNYFDGHYYVDDIYGIQPTDTD